MIPWGWLIPVALLSGSFGAGLLAVIAGGAMRATDCSDRRRVEAELSESDATAETDPAVP